MTCLACTCSLPDKHTCRLPVVPLRSIGGAICQPTAVQAADLMLCYYERLHLLLPTSSHEQKHAQLQRTVTCSFSSSRMKAALRCGTRTTRVKIR